MGRRFQARRANGRFQRNTMASVFGMKVWVCAECRGCNPKNLGQPAPSKCAQCGVPFVEADLSPSEKGGAR